MFFGLGKLSHFNFNQLGGHLYKHTKNIASGAYQGAKQFLNTLDSSLNTVKALTDVIKPIISDSGLIPDSVKNKIGRLDNKFGEGISHYDKIKNEIIKTHDDIKNKVIPILGK